MRYPGDYAYVVLQALGSMHILTPVYGGAERHHAEACATELVALDHRTCEVHSTATGQVVWRMQYVSP